MKKNRRDKQKLKFPATQEEIMAEITQFILPLLHEIRDELRLINAKLERLNEKIDNLINLYDKPL